MAYSGIFSLCLSLSSAVRAHDPLLLLTGTHSLLATLKISRISPLGPSLSGALHRHQAVLIENRDGSKSTASSGKRKYGLERVNRKSQMSCRNEKAHRFQRRLLLNKKMKHFSTPLRHRYRSPRSAVACPSDGSRVFFSPYIFEHLRTLF